VGSGSDGSFDLDVLLQVVFAFSLQVQYYVPIAAFALELVSFSPRSLADLICNILHVVVNSIFGRIAEYYILHFSYEQQAFAGSRNKCLFVRGDRGL